VLTIVLAFLCHIAMLGSLKAHPTALIAQEATLVGDITIGAGCIIHPRASILATAGPIEIGENCVVEELAVLENTGARIDEANGGTMHIGKGNQFSVGCRKSDRLISVTMAE
jgi:dynactin-6